MVEEKQKSGRCLEINQKWLIIFLLIKLIKIYLIKNSLKNGCNIKCHKLKFVKSKKDIPPRYFLNFFKNPPLALHS